MLVPTAKAAPLPTNRSPETNPDAADLVRAAAQRARDLGRELGDALADPARFARELASAFKELADPRYRQGQAFVAPGIGPTFGVRTPIQVALQKGFETASRGASSAELLVVADRLVREPEREGRWFAIAILQRTIGREPERTWQLLRRAAADADDWITVDTLAHRFGKGILAEPYRWAELEQLTVSPSRWERRLVGSTVATMPFVDRTAGRTGDVVRHGLELLGALLGDAEPDVQKALAWGYRSMAMVDVEGTAAALDHEAATAARNVDGHRAWVIRDALGKLDTASAARIRTVLAGVRRRATDPATSEAAGLASRFAAVGLGRRMPEPPLT
jgi:3-methyladenine DNA glycosylase AlkD